MSNSASVDRLLETLYFAVLAPAQWQKFVQDLTRTAGLSGTAMLHQNLLKPSYSFTASCGVDQDMERLYARYYGNIDEYRPRFLTKRPGELAFGEELCPTNQLRKTEFYNDLLRKFDIRLFCAVAIEINPHHIDLISLYQGWRGKLASDEFSGRLIQRLLPHIHNALEIRNRLKILEQQQTSFEAFADRLDVGVALLDEMGRCIFMNAEARQLLRGDDALNLKGSKLGTKWVECPRLDSMITAVSSRAGGRCRIGGTISIPRPGKKPLQITVSPLLEDGSQLTSGVLADPRSAVAVALIFDPEKAPEDFTEKLKSQYGLTTAESRVADLLMRGKSLKEVSEETSVQYATVRAHLRSLFEKVNVHRQGELISVLLRATHLPPKR